MNKERLQMMKDLMEEIQEEHRKVIDYTFPEGMSPTHTDEYDDIIANIQPHHVTYRIDLLLEGWEKVC